MSEIRVPVSTYRIQFNSGFRFVDGRDLVPYLNDLGITDLYSSPRFAARRGSSHGYDIANPLRINSELGTEEDFDELAARLQKYQMGLLLDIVPNHMAASSENPWWRDVLENGRASEYAAFFDINWRPSTVKSAALHENKVLLPLLGKLYGDALLDQELALKIEDSGFYVRYYDKQLPLSLRSTRLILDRGLEQLLASDDPDAGAESELRAILDDLGRLPEPVESDPGSLARRRAAGERVKGRLWNTYQSIPGFKTAVDAGLRQINGVKGDPRSFDELDRILSGQNYRLAFWKIAYEELNYRRFFDINELVGLRVELPRVFDTRHERLLELLGEGKVTGVRVDHVDGLYDPLAYLTRLKESIRSDGGGFYTVVEKILGRHEDLPGEWPIAGTTGYDYLNALNGIFVEPAGLAELERSYARHTGVGLPFAEICYASNKKVMEQLFPGELNGFVQELGLLAAQDREARDIPLSELQQVFLEVTACLPIYRTYIRGFDVSSRDRAYLERTIDLARNRTPEWRVSPAAFDFIRRVLLLEPQYYAEDRKQDWLRFVMRWQQFTGPAMGKGLEDTAFYVHNSLISLNEVGADPLREDPSMNLSEFHAFNRRRQREWPHALNATSTHDTKRSEDVRARVNVLSEIPGEWEALLEDWMRLNASKKKIVGSKPAPDSGEEILFYQALLGAWPNQEAGMTELPARMRAFMTKALREAKTHSSWISPYQEYEQAVCAFIDATLDRSGANPFLESFVRFQERVAFYGALNSLAQVLLKIASPGVPDFYQGTEIWNFSLVDPDNRRPVDYRLRIALLESLKQREAEDRPALLASLVSNWQDHGIKMYLTSKALEFRRAHRELFQRGEYLPVCASGRFEQHVCAFARHLGPEWAIAVAPRWTTRLECAAARLEIRGWDQTALRLPGNAPARWRNILTGESLEDTRLQAVLRDFPVALLHSEAVQ